MAFIYNDEKVEYEDEYARENDCEYDKSQFAVVRKIFIRLNKESENYRENAKNFNEGTIRQEFQKFGDINSVELLTNGKMEANITFADDRSATFAFTYLFYQNEQANRRVKKVGNLFQKWLIEPANTWHQPRRHHTHLQNSTAMDLDDETENEEPPIFNLNVYCFEHLFKFLDVISLFNLSQVCKLFNGMLLEKNGIGHKYFQRSDVSLEIKRFHPYFCKSGMTVGKVRKILRIIGPKIKQIIFYGNASHVGVDGVERFLEKINKYCGENICDLVLEDVRLSSTQLNLQPMFTSLRTLKIRDWSGESVYEFDLQNLCPNLIKVKFEGRINIKRSCRHWPKLQCLSLFVNCKDKETFWSFIGYNPHLKNLKFLYVDNEEFDVIGHNLQNLNTLAISCHSLQFKSMELMNINHLNNLSNLSLIDLEYIDDELLSSIAGFRRLQVLKLGIKRQNISPDSSYILNQGLITDVARQLVHLEKFVLYGVKLEESTILYFIRFASNLKIIHFHYRKYNSMLSRQAILDISHILQQRDKPLQFFFNTKKNWETIVDIEANKLLKLSTGCCHARFQ